MLQVTAAALLVASISGVALDPQGSVAGDARIEPQWANQNDTAVPDERGKFTERIEVVAPEPPPTPAFGSVLLSADTQDLRSFAATTADLIRYAQLMAGAATRPANVLVDGLPANGLPPLDAIAYISIGGDPFSAEYADADVTSIEIVTKAPSRKVRVFAGGDMPGIDGRDMLAPALKTQSRSVNLSVSGPVPRVPFTFSASGGVNRSSQDSPIRVGMTDLGDRLAPAATTNHNESGSLTLHYAPAPSLRVRGSFRESRARGGNVGVGGVTLVEAASSSLFVVRDSRVTATHVSRRVLYEGGAVLTSSDARSRANSLEPGIIIGGDVVMGGASVSDSRRRSTRWTMKHVVRSKSVRPWTLGAVAAGTFDANRTVPNSGGSFYFENIAEYNAALAGAQAGTWTISRISHVVDFASRTAAGFAQTELVRRGELALSGGVRADYQSGFGVTASPRISLAARWHDVGIRAGAGMFVQRVPERIFLTVLENDGLFMHQLESVSAIRSKVSDDLAPPRAFQWRASAERSFGALMTALEYSASDERRLIGSDRLRSGSDWVDIFTSNRRAVRHRLHAHSRYVRKGQQLVADYELARARDNTDGPFSFPQMSGRLSDEWARSAGVPAHSLTVMGALALPAGVSLNIVDNWRSSTPYNITTGRDAGNGLFIDRGGRARNSGNGPRFHSVSLYAYRRIELARVHERMRGVGVNLSLQADNILNNVNVLGVGSVAGSTTFEQPLAAYPGRSVRLLFSVN